MSTCPDCNSALEESNEVQTHQQAEFREKSIIVIEYRLYGAGNGASRNWCIPIHKTKNCYYLETNPKLVCTNSLGLATRENISY